MNPQTDNNFAAFIGIDWADAKHDLCLQAADSDKREFDILLHRSDAIDTWASALRQRFQGRPVAVCLETAKGPLVYALQKFDFLVLFPVNPATLAKYRQAFKPSHAKADPTDAELALEILIGHRDKLHALNPQSTAMRTLGPLLEERRRLINDQTRFTNRLTSALKDYFPQALDWFDDKATTLFCDFLTRWPTLKQVQLARRTTLESFFYDHHSRSPNLLKARLAAIKSARPLTEDPAVIEPKRLLVEALVEQLRATMKAIAHFDAEIANVCQSLPDYELFRALALSSLLACLRLSENSGIATRVQGKSRGTWVLRPSRKAAASSTGCTGAWRVPSFCVKHLSSGLTRRSLDLSGPELTISSNAPRGQHTRWRYGLLPSSGSVFFTAAGRTVPRMMNRNT